MGRNMRKSNKKQLSRDEVIALYDTYVPVVTEKICEWKSDEKGMVTLYTENKGAMNTIMQKLIRKPRFSQIHLDEMGSFIWKMCDGQTDIHAIAGAVHEEFGNKADPLYDRLLKFFEIVESYGFVRWLKPAK